MIPMSDALELHARGPKLAAAAKLRPANKIPSRAKSESTRHSAAVKLRGVARWFSLQDAYFVT